MGLGRGAHLPVPERARNLLAMPLPMNFIEAAIHARYLFQSQGLSNVKHFSNEKFTVLLKQ